MNKTHKTLHLGEHVEDLSAENASSLEGGFRGSKTEALMALEYDRIPNVLKTARAINIQRKLATAVMIMVPLLLLAIAVIGGLDAYLDRQRSEQAQRASAKWGDNLRNTVEQSLKRVH
ncbi:hypothetical protein [Novosphingobium sp. PASSN1]|uniref:hypothetical protein n=1 Tax=Novosphingobium sp. PASSN1 TaxID=2015561 RepID=UPI0025DB4E8D|nr:hypothetical protein [Novosphingobium sp. PASSN1]